jgi:hypothetical protein
MTVPPVEKQPQIINSTDNKLQILHHAGSVDNFGCYSIKGAIRNLSSEANVDIEIKVDYYNSEGVIIDKVTDLLNIPKPGGSRGFIIIYPGLRHDDIYTYKMYPFLKNRQ